MGMSRKGAVLMLMVAVLWAVLPASACLLTGRSVGHRACCTAMGRHCPMEHTEASCVCGETHGENAAIAPEAQPSPTQVQAVVFLSHRASLLIDCPSAAVSQLALEAPPDPSPGGLSILRI